MTVWESMTYDVDPAKTDEFVNVLRGATEIFREADGCYAMEVQASALVPGRVHLYLEWETVEHHTVIFAASEARHTLRAALMPYIVGRGESDHSTSELRASFR